MFHRAFPTDRERTRLRRVKTVKTVIAKSGDTATNETVTNDPGFLTRAEDRLVHDQRKAFQALDGTRGT